jgi:hypothetical protein
MLPYRAPAATAGIIAILEPRSKAYTSPPQESLAVNSLASLAMARQNPEVTHRPFSRFSHEADAT